jgi:hypothetical protein
MADEETESMETAPMLRKILAELREFRAAVELSFDRIEA